MDTASQVIDDFQMRFPDINDANALRLLNMIHKRIVSRLGIRDSTLDISLTDGAREYDLAEAATQIRKAYYVSSATDGDYHELYETSQDKLDLTDGSWRRRPNEEKPLWYYIATAVTGTRTSKKQIGFDPIPPTTSSGGYPKVTLYITTVDDLQAADAIPTALQDSQIYLDGMSWLFMKEQRDDAADFWKIEYEKRVHEEIAFINKMTRHEPTAYYPAWVRGRAVV